MSIESKDSRPVHITGVDVQSFALYGTLRDDDDSGASYTKAFTSGHDSAISGRVNGFKLFFSPFGDWPSAVRTGKDSDVVVVRCLQWPTRREFEEKVKQADEIEGSEYERTVVSVKVDGSDKHVQSFMYVYAKGTVPVRPIESGDWLKRVRKPA